MEELRNVFHNLFNMNIDFNRILSNIKKGVYQRLGEGSGRVVFDLENGKVVKVAKNQKGLAQNKAEYKISLNNSSGMLAKILSISKDSKLLIMEKADRIRRISTVWEYFDIGSNWELFQIPELINICKKHNLEIKDFSQAANWGLMRGKPIIIDYGFTKQIKSKYYSSIARRIMNKF